MKYEQLHSLSPQDFKRSLGVLPDTFAKMVEIVSPHHKLGCKSKLCIEEHVIITLMYFREYRAQFHIAQDYQVSESTVCRIIQKTERILVRSELFNLPSKKKLTQVESDDEIVFAIDATEQKVERPKKRQKQHYSGKQKCHTQKAQIIVNVETKQVQATAFGRGKQHDFALFKQSKIPLASSIVLLADSGYQGLQHYHANCRTPYKKSKNKPLTQAQKAANRQLAKARIVVENVIRSLKIFKILALPYRNRRRGFGLRFNLIAGIYNYEIDNQK